MEVIEAPALGKQVQIGELYNARLMQRYAGVSLWSSAEVASDSNVTLTGGNCEFYFCASTKELREKWKLSAEGSLLIDAGLAKVDGSVSCLKERSNTQHEATVYIMCSRENRKRSLRTDVVVDVKNAQWLENENFTHYVSEVTEGGYAVLTFTQKCASKEEALQVSGKLSASLRGLVYSPVVSVSGTVGADVSSTNAQKIDTSEIQVSMQGTVVLSVTSFEEAVSVARRLPDILAEHTNTMSFVLNPLNIIDNKYRRLVRELSDNIVGRLSDAFGAGRSMELELCALGTPQQREQYPFLSDQIQGVTNAWREVRNKLQCSAREILPHLKSGDLSNDEYDRHELKLLHFVTIFERCHDIAQRFVANKRDELDVLDCTISAVTGMGMEDNVSVRTLNLVDGSKPRLVLNFGGAKLMVTNHPSAALLKDMIHEPESQTISALKLDDVPPSRSSSSSSLADMDSEGAVAQNSQCVEWFRDSNVKVRLERSCSNLKQLLSCNAHGDIRFVVGFLEKAAPWSRRATLSTTRKRVAAQIGDVILDDGVRPPLIVTNNLPCRAPSCPSLHVTDQSITVSWSYKEDDEYFKPASFVVCYRPRPGGDDGRAWRHRIEADEPFVERQVSGTAHSCTLSGLHDGVKYEVQVYAQLSHGLLSNRSESSFAETLKLATEAESLLDFYFQNEAQLSEPRRQQVVHPSASTSESAAAPTWARQGMCKSWEFDKDLNALFLGFRVSETRSITSRPFEGQLGVAVVDVIPQYKPDIEFPDSLEDAHVLLFAGASGHGKSTQINAFVSFLLGGELNDRARMMLIDDRGVSQADSVTNIVTLYRLRPLSPNFGGKHIVIVDTPGFLDTRGHQRDVFIDCAMQNLFDFIHHVNAVALCCKSDEQRTHVLEPAVRYVLRLFDKNVKGHLRTVVSHSSIGKPQCVKTLKKLGWPCDEFIQVQNRSFSLAFLADKESLDRAILSSEWNMSMRGQQRLKEMVLTMENISMDLSAQVVSQRMQLQERSELCMKKILRQTSELIQLTNRLESISRAVTASPGEKIKCTEIQYEKVDTPAGVYNTFCGVCLRTCHENCEYQTEIQKLQCIAMGRDGSCVVCPQSCRWDQHASSTFIIKPVEKVFFKVPDDLIKHWNENTTTYERAVLDAIDNYEKSLERLHSDICELAKISTYLTENALHHDPQGWVRYYDTLIRRAVDMAASPEQVLVLTNAKQAMILQRGLVGSDSTGSAVTYEQKVLARVFGEVKEEMIRRTNMSAQQRFEEENKPCTTYNKLLQSIPPRVRGDKLVPLPQSSSHSTGSSYKTNLAAIVKLVQELLKANPCSQVAFETVDGS